MTTLLNIAALSRRTGVAPDTLRKWEQRYDVLHPTRTPGGQRRYGERDVQRVEWLRDRLGEGWRIGEAARVLQETVAPPLDDPCELRDALIAAAAATDTAQATAVLDQVFAVLPLEDALSDVLCPALEWLGDAWQRDEISVAQEHAVTAKVRGRLELLLADARGAVRGTAVLACAPGEQHDVGLLMLAVMLRGDGWRVEYLGASTPVSHAVAFAEAIGATMLAFSASRDEPLAELSHGLGRLGRGPLPALALGGAAVSADVAREMRATTSDERLGRVVERLRRISAA